MKNREEYLVEYENKLINQYTEIFKNQGKNLFTIYILTGFYLLFTSGFIKELNLFGNKIELGIENLKLFIPFVLFALYVFVNYQTIRIAKIIQKIRINSIEILALNPESKPLSVDDIFFFSSGLSGLVLAFSKWQFRFFVNQKFFSHYKSIKKQESFLKRLPNFILLLYNVGLWLILSILSMAVILSLYLLPLIVVLTTIIQTTESEIFTEDYKIIAIIILSLSILGTVVSIIALLFLYLNDLIEDLKKDVQVSIEDLKKTMMSRILIRLTKNVIELTIGSVK